MLVAGQSLVWVSHRHGRPDEKGIGTVETESRI